MTSKSTVRQVPFNATLAPICTPSTAPAGKATRRRRKPSRSTTSETVAVPCTMPAIHTGGILQGCPGSKYPSKTLSSFRSQLIYPRMRRVCLTQLQVQ